LVARIGRSPHQAIVIRKGQTRAKVALRLRLNVAGMTSAPNNVSQSRFDADFGREPARPAGHHRGGILREIIPSDGGGIVAVNCRDKPDATSG
jgi:hypothetical protein